MAETFVLRYPTAAADEAEWLVVDARGARVSEVGRGTLAAAAAAQGAHRLVVLVPGTEVSIAAPVLPARRGTLARLVAFALEEQLATEIDAMHFAVGRQDADGRVPTVAVERERLAAWLAALGAVGLTPAAVYADALAVPANPAHVVLVLDGARLAVRRPGALPLVLEADPLGAALEVAGIGPGPGEEPAGEQHLMVYAAADDWAARQAEIEALRDRVATLKVQVLAEGVLPLYAATAVTEPPISLLQGEFLPRQGLAGQWARWRVPAALAAGFVLLHLATLGVDWWRLRGEEARVDQALRAAAGEALPGAGNLARQPNLRLLVESRVRRVRAAANEGLLGTLGVLAGAVAAAPGTQLQSLSYRGGTTDLTLDAPDVAALDRVQQAARGSGFDAQLQGANQREQRYEGRLQLKGPGS
ncbi:MAG: hypothetical protein JSR73_09965 [Proteobacteria bacterium]|nr:hypothetical protein [Pseudomonadota bacterium]